MIPYLSRREFLKFAALLGGAAAYPGGGRKAEKSGNLQKRPEVPKDEVETETKQENPTSITGVVIPLGNGKEMTTAAIAIDISVLGLKVLDLEKITVISTEPNLNGLKSTFYIEGSDNIAKQMSFGMRDPSMSEKLGNTITSPNNIFYYPLVETAQTNYEAEIIKLGITAIWPRNELTGNKPSVPRDYTSGTMFKVELHSTGEVVNSYELGPYR